jgi:hypothetical protein
MHTFYPHIPPYMLNMRTIMKINNTLFKMSTNEKDYNIISEQIKQGVVSYYNPLWIGAIEYAKGLGLSATKEQKERYTKQAKEIIYFEAKNRLKEFPSDKRPCRNTPE